MKVYLVLLALGVGAIHGFGHKMLAVPGVQGARAHTTLRDASASAETGKLSAVVVEGATGAQGKRGGTATRLGSAGASAEPADAATAYGVGASDWAGGGRGEVALGSAAAQARDTAATSALAHSRMTGAKGGDKYKTTGKVGRESGAGARRKRQAQAGGERPHPGGSVLGHQGSAGTHAGDSSTVLSMGATLADASRDGNMASSSMSAGSTGVKVGKIATAVSLGSALDVGGNGKQMFASGVNAGSTAAGTDKSDTTLSVGTSTIKRLPRPDDD